MLLTAVKHKGGHLRSHGISYIRVAMLGTSIGTLRTFLRRPLGRRLIVVVAIIIAIVVLFRIVAPFLISSSLVRDRMERAVEAWTGHDVTIGGTPDIRFWPEPRITLPDVTIRETDDANSRLLGSVRRVSASFDLLETLIGRPVFKNFHLSDPHVFVQRMPDGHLNWSDSGLLSQAVQKARPSGGQQALDTRLDVPIGAIRVRGGTLDVLNQADGRSFKVTGIDGDIAWHSLADPIHMTASARFGTQPITLDFSSPEPLLLLAGRDGRASAAMQSSLFEAKFDGLANLATHGFLSGDASLSTGDFPRLAKWTGAQFPGMSELKAISLQARVLTSDGALRFENLSFDIDGVEGTGIVDLVTPAGRPPRLTGTLALQNVNFLPVIQTAAPLLMEDTAEAKALRNRLELDLRLSVKKATLGPFEIDEVALGLMNTQDQSRLDILDGDFAGGRLTGRFASIKEGANGGLAVRMALHSVDFASIIQQLSLQGPLPAARGSAELDVDIARPLTAEAWRNAKGSIHFTAGAGTISGLNLGTMRQLAAKSAYFSLSQASDGTLGFSGIDLNAALANGSADIRSSTITGTNDTIALAGVVPYLNNSLALSATVQPMAADGTTPASGRPPETYFIGGSWPNPVIWPISRPAQPAGQD
ncbi:MAG: AsmA family protein [Neorhizobium sp.]|nr:AsmA family protein [Neorhizobium sp.]